MTNLKRQMTNPIIPTVVGLCPATRRGGLGCYFCGSMINSRTKHRAHQEWHFADLWRKRNHLPTRASTSQSAPYNQLPNNKMHVYFVTSDSRELLSRVPRFAIAGDQNSRVLYTKNWDPYGAHKMQTASAKRLPQQTEQTAPNKTNKSQPSAVSRSSSLIVYRSVLSPVPSPPSPQSHPQSPSHQIRHALRRSPGRKDPSAARPQEKPHREENVRRPRLPALAATSVAARGRSFSSSDSAKTRPGRCSARSTPGRSTSRASRCGAGQWSSRPAGRTRPSCGGGSPGRWSLQATCRRSRLWAVLRWRAVGQHFRSAIGSACRGG